MRPDEIINIDSVDLWQSLQSFERRAGIPRLRWWTRRKLRSEVDRIEDLHHRKRQALPSAHEMRFNSANAPAVWPLYGDFLVPELKPAIERLYAEDFAAYCSTL